VFVDLRGLALRGGDRYEREYPLDMAPIFLGGARYDVLVPGGVRIVVDRVAGGFLVKVSLAAKVYGPCARCLAEVVFDTEAEQQEFVPTTQEGWDEGDLSAFVADLVVNVDGIAREAIVLNLPAQVLCSSSCRGLCCRCGQDLNRGSCECPPVQVDDRWGGLKDIGLER
jgi:uncharacterized protein